MENYTLLESFDEECEGIPYHGEIFYSRQNRATFCKISFSLPEKRTIQKVSCSEAISAVEKEIAKHLKSEKIKVSSKRFLVIPISPGDWDIEDYYQDLENYDETQWISVSEDNVIMDEIAPGVWEFNDDYHIAVETTLNLNRIDKKMQKDLDTFILDSLKDAYKSLTKKVRAIEQKWEKKDEARQ